MRIDRWLWSVRIYKTRTLATDACKRNWVHLNGVAAKPSRELKIGDLVTAKSGPVKREFKVRGVLEKRISAKIVDDYLEDITPQAEYEKARALKKNIIGKPLGKRGAKGRPSKKERRDLEDFFYNSENF